MSAAFDLAAWSAPLLARTESAFARWVGAGAPESLRDAMRYAVQGGGKRLRPLLVHAAAQAAGGAAAARSGAALRAGCAVELIHAYSLVHDDMPCMDDDVLRRGQPTVHVRFGEATALLAGDALQALAFEVLLPGDEGGDEPVPLTMQAVLARQLAVAAGAHGMAGGQAIDLASVGRPLAEPELRAMHRMKTGALLLASVCMGAACAPGVQPAVHAALHDYGEAIGLAFQVVDDILDVTADSATLGKTAGKDAAADKPTYVALLGLDGARAEAEQLHDRAQAALQAMHAAGQADTAPLAALADLVVRRSH